MTASSGALGAPGGGGPAAPTHPIVAAIAAQRDRERRRFRLIFVATWLIVIGGALASLVVAGKIDFPFMGEWAPYIVGGVTTTIYVAVISIVFAIMFAVMGALGRLSSHAILYSLSTLYVSVVRGHAAARPDPVHLPRAPADCAVHQRRPQGGPRHLRARLQLRGVHDGDVPRGHPGRATRPDRGRPGARHAGSDPGCAGSSSRRRCGSSPPPWATNSSR